MQCSDLGWHCQIQFKKNKSEMLRHGLALLEDAEYVHCTLYHRAQTWAGSLMHGQILKYQRHKNADDSDHQLVHYFLLFRVSEGQICYKTVINLKKIVHMGENV